MLFKIAYSLFQVPKYLTQSFVTIIMVTNNIWIFFIFHFLIEFLIQLNLFVSHFLQ